MSSGYKTGEDIKEKLIREFLDSKGVDPIYCGYNYILEIVALYMETPTIKIGKVLNEVCRIYNVSNVTVRSNIHNATRSVGYHGYKPIIIECIKYVKDNSDL